MKPFETTPSTDNPEAAFAQTLTVGRRTALKEAHLSTGLVSDPISQEETEVSNVVLHSVTFRANVPLPPGTIRYLRATGGDARLASGIRVASCKLRPDSTFDIKAEFF